MLAVHKHDQPAQHRNPDGSGGTIEGQLGCGEMQHAVREELSMQHTTYNQSQTLRMSMPVGFWSRQSCQLVPTPRQARYGQKEEVVAPPIDTFFVVTAMHILTHSNRRA